MSKPKPTVADRVWVNGLGYGWMAAWAASIWWEPHRWELFWSGAFALFLALLLVSAKDFTKPSPTDSENAK